MLVEVVEIVEVKLGVLVPVKKNRKRSALAAAVVVVGVAPSTSGGGNKVVSCDAIHVEMMFAC